MGGKKKCIEMFGSFTEPFNCISYKMDILEFLLFDKSAEWDNFIEHFL